MFTEEEILKKREEFLKIKTVEEMEKRKSEFRSIFFEIYNYKDVEKHLDDVYGDYAFQKFFSPLDEVYRTKDGKW